MDFRMTRLVLHPWQSWWLPMQARQIRLINAIIARLQRTPKGTPRDARDTGRILGSVLAGVDQPLCQQL